MSHIDIVEEIFMFDLSLKSIHGRREIIFLEGMSLSSSEHGLFGKTSRS